MFNKKNNVQNLRSQFFGLIVFWVNWWETNGWLMCYRERPCKHSVQEYLNNACVLGCYLFTHIESFDVKARQDESLWANVQSFCNTCLKTSQTMSWCVRNRESLKDSENHTQWKIINLREYFKSFYFKFLILFFLNMVC